MKVTVGLERWIGRLWCLMEGRSKLLKRISRSSCYENLPVRPERGRRKKKEVNTSSITLNRMGFLDFIIPFYSRYILYLLKILHIIIHSSIILVNEKFCQLSAPHKVAVLQLYYTSSSILLWRVFLPFNICIFNSMLWLLLFSLTFDSLEMFASISEISVLALINQCTPDSKVWDACFLQYQLTVPPIRIYTNLSTISQLYRKL